MLRYRPSQMVKKGFTLIELLIVVAIIAILAAIAVPNFLEAQTRAKVVKVITDFRAIKTGLESYRIDNNRYPLASALGNQDRYFEDQMNNWSHVTTPVAYLSSIPLDRFLMKNIETGGYGKSYTRRDQPYTYYAMVPEGFPTYDLWKERMQPAGVLFSTFSPGPNQINDAWSDPDRGLPRVEWTTTHWLYDFALEAEGSYNMTYNPTNGTISRGILFMNNKRIYGGPM